MKKSVILGVCDAGVKFYNENKDALHIVAYIDNSQEYVGKFLNGTPIYPAADIPRLSIHKIYVASERHIQMYAELLKELKIPPHKISYEIIEREKRDQQILNTSLNNMMQYLEAVQIRDFNERWESIKKRYAKVKVFWMRVGTIGELIPRYFAVAENEPSDSADNVLRVYLPIMENGTRIGNKELIKFLRQKIYIPMEDDLPFWIHVMIRHYNELDVTEIDKYMSRHPYPVYKVEPYETEFLFSPKDHARGHRAMEQMGLKEPYAIVVPRTATYNNTTMGHDMDYAYRNMDFSAFEKTIDYLGTKGIVTIKMGREYPLKEPLENCIDYAGLYADEWLDLYLFAHAQFLVCADTGVFTFAGMFGLPMLKVNTVPISFGLGACRYTDKNMFILKKYYSKPKKRFLSLMEIIDVDNECLIWGSKYAEKGIEFIDNTPEEIQKATEEFLGRLCGTWEDTEEDKKNFLRWEKILAVMNKRCMSNKNVWTGVPFPHRLAATFMRDNPYLLE